jgi:hypothetical protein
MEQLTIKNTSKEEAIKQINKFRLQNKNSWYQVSIFLGRFKYELKIYNTWTQIGRKRFVDTNNLVGNCPSDMDLNIKEFKEYLSNFINH